MMKPSTKQHDDKNDIQGKSDIQKKISAKLSGNL